jgi:outer membrane lipoprotein-sorting protein
MKPVTRPAVFAAIAFAMSVFAASAASAQSSEHVRTPAPPKVENTTPAAPAAPVEAETKAETEAAPSTEGNPVGVSSGWDTNVKEQPPQASQFGAAPDQAEIIQKVNAYFNEMKNLEGEFLQTDPDAKEKKGRFYIQRPGKVRFDYSRPSMQKIISDGEYLAIEDHDMNTTDRYPLSSTPFRLLLKETVDLANDAHIVAMDVGEKILVITLEDKENRGRGQIRLFFEWPELQLSEWIISDAQGLDTRIQLGSLEMEKEVDPKLFKFSSGLGLPDFRNSRD